MGLLYDVDHAMRDRQYQKKVQRAKQEQMRKDAMKDRKAREDRHRRHENGELW